MEGRKRVDLEKAARDERDAPLVVALSEGLSLAVREIASEERVSPEDWLRQVIRREALARIEAVLFREGGR